LLSLLSVTVALFKLVVGGGVDDDDDNDVDDLSKNVDRN